MRFWDSSAIVPVLLSEKETAECKNLLKKDPEIAVWALTSTEVLSAVYRKAREGSLVGPHLSPVLENLRRIAAGWNVVTQLETTRDKANRLLAVHPLRAGDALQLAAALITFEEHPEGEEFVTLDKNLADAARREGFYVLP